MVFQSVRVVFHQIRAHKNLNSDYLLIFLLRLRIQITCCNYKLLLSRIWMKKTTDDSDTGFYLGHSTHKNYKSSEIISYGCGYWIISTQWRRLNLNGLSLIRLSSNAHKNNESCNQCKDETSIELMSGNDKNWRRKIAKTYVKRSCKLI